MPFFDLKTEFETVVAKLTPETKPLWGMMTAQHMLEHILLVINAGIGKFPVSIYTPEDKIPRSKAFLMSEKPMPREFKAPNLPQEETMPLRFPDFETAKEKLRQGIANFYAYYENNPEAIHPHPVFGMCNFEEWDMMQRKHFTHHFTQFGLLEA